jgi:predicted DNA-binding transcriptional regulator YafY
MPVNHSAYLRYTTLDKCFSNFGRLYFIEDLIEECRNAIEYQTGVTGAVSRSTIFNDIQFMESDAGGSIPLLRLKEGRRIYYRYSDRKFKWKLDGLNSTELQQLKTTLKTLSKIAGGPQREWLEEIVTKLDANVQSLQNEKVVMDLSNNIDLRGQKFLNPIFNAIVNERVLRVEYKHFKSEESYEITFHPYYLKQFNNRWFALGLNEANGIETWNLAIDRIESLKETNLNYISTDFNFSDYFDEIIGVTRPNDTKLEEVKLLFSHNIAPYITTKPLHPTQKHKSFDHGLEVRIEVIPNFELEKVILGYGNDVEVIYPKSLRDKIKNTLTIALSNYKTNDK